MSEACRAVGKLLAELWARVEQSTCGLTLVAFSAVQSFSSSLREHGKRLAAHGAEQTTLVKVRLRCSFYNVQVVTSCLLKLDELVRFP